MSTYSYDEIAYISTSFPQTHPIKAATIARLFGVAAPDMERCNVLELGCADGANILPMAQNYPNSTFVGIDLSIKQIEAGQKTIRETGLSNITIDHKNILDFDRQGMQFDYIIVHGVYSWVPEVVRERILSLCREALTPNGVAYISYNALPGWHMRGMLRDMMLFHTVQFTEQTQKIAQARALLKFLSDSVPTENNSYGQFLRGELNAMTNWTDSYLRHEFLEEDNRAFYFHEFSAAAAKHDLQYLGEPELSSVLPTNFAPEVQGTLYKIARNITAMEQYMDFLRNRTFRMTLLVKKEHKLNRSINPIALREFWFGSAARPLNEKVNLDAGVKEDFRIGKSSVTSDSTLVKAVIVALHQAAPAHLHFKEVVTAVRELLAISTNGIRDRAQTEQEETVLCDQLLVLLSRGMVEAIVRPHVPVATSFVGKPITSPLIRYQALHHPSHVTTLRHSSINVDTFARHLISLLDGTRDMDALIQGMAEKVQSGVFSVHDDGQPITDGAKLTTILKPRVELVTAHLAKLALLQQP